MSFTGIPGCAVFYAVVCRRTKSGERASFVRDIEFTVVRKIPVQIDHRTSLFLGSGCGYWRADKIARARCRVSIV